MVDASWVGVLPVFAFVLIGWASRRFGLMDESFAKRLLLFALYVPMTVVTFMSISTVHFVWSDLVLFVGAPVLALSQYVLARHWAPWLTNDRTKIGTLILSQLIMNTGFILTFAYFMLTPDALVKVIIADLGSALTVYSFVFGIAVLYAPRGNGHSAPAPGFVIRKVLALPPFLGALGGLALFLTGATLPAIVVTILDPVKNLAFPLLALATGALLAFEKPDAKLITAATFSRIVVGLALGFILASAFGVDPLTRKILLATMASPVGFNTMTFAASEKLDLKLASGAFFTSALLCLILTPAIILFA